MSDSDTGTKTATFSLGNESKYGVAVRCGDSDVKVIQATNSELANPKIVCSSPPSPTPSMVPFTVNVNIDSSLLAEGDQVCINLNCGTAAANTKITVNLEPSKPDLLITLKDGSNWVKVAKVERGVDVAGGRDTTVILEPSDQLEPEPFSGPSVPTEYSINVVGVSYLSGNNTAFGALNASSTSYRPVRWFSGGDRYVAMAYATNAYAKLFLLQLFSGGRLSLSFPQPWSSGSLTIQQNAHPIFPSLGRTDDDLRAYLINFQLYDSSQPSRLSHTTVLSKGWLDGSTSYSVPDLSGLLGYNPPSNGSKGTLMVTALLSNKDVNKDVPFLLTDLAEPVTLAALVAVAGDAGDYLKAATVRTDYTVGGGEIHLP
ncbi:MAG: peptidase S8 and S53 subtilisin kexin sedolisin [Thermaceae bacterium]